MCASFGADGRWLSFGAPHPRHGFVELNALPRFDESWRGDPAAVRRYRSWMSDDGYAFVSLDCASPIERASHTAWARPASPVIVSRYCVRRIGNGTDPAVIRYDGTLDRPAYAEITDISPLPPLQAPNRLLGGGHELRVEAATLPATATLSVEVEGAGPARWLITGARTAEATLGWTARELVVTVSCAMHVPPP